MKIVLLKVYDQKTTERPNRDCQILFRRLFSSQKHLTRLYENNNISLLSKFINKDSLKRNRKIASFKKFALLKKT